MRAERLGHRFRREHLRQPSANAARRARFAQFPFEGAFDEKGKTCKRHGLDPIPFDADPQIVCGDSRSDIPNGTRAKIVVTDPPSQTTSTIRNWQISSTSGCALSLGMKTQQFAAEYCPKSAEIVENPTRGLSIKSFEEGLTDVLKASSAQTDDDGLVVFTFHHAEGSSWESVLNAICNAGLIIEAIYPVHAESESSLHLMDKQAIAYDLIHVCKKRRPEDVATKRSWAGLRQLVRQRARHEIERIESGRYGGQPLLAPDVRMVLIGKCLEVYSRHYGAVLDWDGQPLPLRTALQDIRVMVELVVSRDAPLPAELETADALSQVWLLALCDKREVSVDSISKLTRGIFEVSDLTGHKPPILRKGRMKVGRTYEVLTPLERLNALRVAFERQVRVLSNSAFLLATARRMSTDRNSWTCSTSSSLTPSKANGSTSSSSVFAVDASRCALRSNISNSATRIAGARHARNCCPSIAIRCSRSSSPNPPDARCPDTSSSPKKRATGKVSSRGGKATPDAAWAVRLAARVRAGAISL